VLLELFRSQDKKPLASLNFVLKANIQLKQLLRLTLTDAPTAALENGQALDLKLHVRTKNVQWANNLPRLTQHRVLTAARTARSAPSLAQESRQFVQFKTVQQASIQPSLVRHPTLMAVQTVKKVNTPTKDRRQVARCRYALQDSIQICWLQPQVQMDVLIAVLANGLAMVLKLLVLTKSVQQVNILH